MQQHSRSPLPGFHRLLVQPYNQGEFVPYSVLYLNEFPWSAYVFVAKMDCRGVAAKPKRVATGSHWMARCLPRVSLLKLHNDQLIQEADVEK